MGCLSAVSECPRPCARLPTPQPEWGDVQYCVSFVGMQSNPRMSAAAILGVWRGLHTSLDASSGSSDTSWGCKHPQKAAVAALIVRC